MMSHDGHVVFYYYVYVCMHTHSHCFSFPNKGSGDVKYHLGTSQERLNEMTQKVVKIAIVANPSHLEGGRS